MKNTSPFQRQKLYYPYTLKKEPDSTLIFLFFLANKQQCFADDNDRPKFDALFVHRSGSFEWKQPKLL